MAQLIYGTTDRTQGVLNYTVSESASQVTISASSDLQAKSYYQSGYQITTSVGSESTSAEDYIRYLYGSFNTAFSTGTVSETYTKNYSPYTVTVSSSYTGKNVSGYLAGSKSGSTSATITIPAKASYAVSYNANGGSGAPGAQTKWYNETLSISPTVPSRTGYSFVGWGTSPSDTSADYYPNGAYNSNAPITLYAIWSANTYTISYNANGGSGAPGNQTKTYGVTLTLSSTRPTRAYYNFLGWSTSSSATTAQYSAGGSFSTNANTTLYAVWQLAYTKPSITNVNIYRANDNSGTANDEGTYITYKFNWSIFSSVSLQSIKLEYKLTTASSWTTGATLTPSGTSGTVNTTVGGGLIDITKTYDVRIVVTDTRDYGQYYTIIATSSTLIDADVNNNAVAVGKYAEKPNTFEIALDVDFKNPEQVKGNLNITPAGIGALPISGGVIDGSLDVEAPNGERHIGANYKDGKVYLFGNTATGNHGLYDTVKGYIINLNGTTPQFNGNASTASNVSGVDTSAFNAVQGVSGANLFESVKGTLENNKAKVIAARINYGPEAGMFGIYTDYSTGLAWAVAGQYTDLYHITGYYGDWQQNTIYTSRHFAWKKASVSFSSGSGSVSASGVTTSSTVIATRGDSAMSGGNYAMVAADCNSNGTIKMGLSNTNSGTYLVNLWWSK